CSLLCSFMLLCLIPPPPTSTLFPYTTLFRSIGHATAEALVDHGLVRGLDDLYELRPEDVARLPHFTLRSAGKLVDAIQRSKKVELRRFLFALGIPGAGESAARDLALHFRSLDRLRRASVDELRRAPGVGP